MWTCMSPSDRLALRNSSSPAIRSTRPPQNGRRRRQWRKTCQKPSVVATYPSIKEPSAMVEARGTCVPRASGLTSVAFHRGAVRLRQVDLEGQAGERERTRSRRVRRLLQVGDGDVVGLLAE